MARLSLVLLLAAAPLVLGGPFSSLFHKHKAHYNPAAEDAGSDGPGTPLLLTPYIENGQIELARNLSVVKGIAGLSSYAAFFTVNATYNSNMYFWFFPAQSGQMDAPLLLWLQGGPGGSSLFGLFNENGPLYVDQGGQVHRRNITWNTNFHMLYIDNPVGTGFSFTENVLGLSTNESEVATNLYSALIQFFTVFSDYQKNDFYITGESYAGKYVPAIGYKIHIENMQQPKIFINMKGIAIGDGLCDPVNMYQGLASMVFEFGLADGNQANYIQNETDTMISYIQKGEFFSAFEVFDMLLNGDLYPYPTYFYNITGATDYFNILRINSPAAFNYYVPYVNQTSVRSAIHVGNLSYGSQSDMVEKALIYDIMDSVADWLATLMDNYKTLLYNGQLDVIVGAPLTERYLTVLPWSGLQQYLKAERMVWRIGDDVAGYVRQVESFMQGERWSNSINWFRHTQEVNFILAGIKTLLGMASHRAIPFHAPFDAIVRGAGHIVPYDQPERMFNLIETFINM